jgi:hypothetical protein
MSAYDTAMASEFYVMSMLYRFGADASLSLGNKKAVDISVILAAGDAITIDVKGVSKRNDWPIRTSGVASPQRHFYALVCYNGKIHDPKTIPDVWIFPHNAILELVKPYKDGRMEVVSQLLVRKNAGRYKDAWYLLGCGPSRLSKAGA